MLNIVELYHFLSNFPKEDEKVIIASALISWVFIGKIARNLSDILFSYNTINQILVVRILFLYFFGCLVIFSGFREILTITIYDVIAFLVAFNINLEDKSLFYRLPTFQEKVYGIIPASFRKRLNLKKLN